MEIWKRNLIVCWLSAFFVGAGLSQIAPVLPLFIEQLGIHSPNLIAQWSGIAFGVQFISMAIFSPIWGLASDKYGRKPMLIRASLWLTIIMACMAYVQDVYQLTVLRAAQGALSGYVAAAITLVATQTPQEKVGWALGSLSAGHVAGQLMGPLIGGAVAEMFGLRSIFVFIAFLTFVAFIATVSFVKEEFTPSEVKMPTMREAWKSITNQELMKTLFLTAFMIQFALMSAKSLITIYIVQLSQDITHVALVSGLVFAAAGVSNVIAAPKLGKIGDRIGSQKVMLASLIFASIFFMMQANVKTVWQLGVLYCFVGLVTGGLLPSVNTLVKRNIPNVIAGRIFSLTQTSQYLGAFSGAMIGGQIAAFYGIGAVFLTTGVLLLGNAFWVYKKIFKTQI